MIKDEETKAFFEFLMSNKASTDYTGELKVYVADAKQSTENKRQYMVWERQRAYDLETGYAEGVRNKAIEAAENLLREVDSPEKVSRCIGLPLKQVLELKEKISVKA